jgi:hypothetical protein
MPGVTKVPVLVADHIGFAVERHEKEGKVIKMLEEDPLVRRSDELELLVRSVRARWGEVGTELHAARVAASKNKINWRKVFQWLGIGPEDAPARDTREDEEELTRLIRKANPDGIEVYDELDVPITLRTAVLANPTTMLDAA